MKLVYPIPRNSLAWLLFAFLAVIAPHLERLPPWSVLAAVVALLWRVQVFRGLWNFPAAWSKYLLAAMSVAGLLLSYGRLTGLEPMVALLVVGFSFKLIEMHQRRDAVLVIYLGYLVSATQLLFSQSIGSALYVVVVYLFITTALLGLHQAHSERYLLRSLGVTGKLLLQAIPMMLVLFIVMPRLGALWSVPMQEHAAQTGVSDTMAPGDFSSLSHSGALAFRATFAEEMPPLTDLYWRGLVFSRFDGRRWSQALPSDYRESSLVRWHHDPPASWEAALVKQGNAIHYDVILEPTQQRWLYTLATPEPQNPGVGLTRDFRLVSQMPIQKKYSYQVTSHLDYKEAPQRLPGWQRRNETRLPEDFNPQTQQLGQQWRAQAGSDAAYIDRVLRWFNQEFIYTLEPPLLGTHSVDEFLFTTKRGFCEHFASSFALLMRAANIPARVVAGYQGGEVNPFQDYLLVHQFDAHAWTEVWLAGKGWVRIDPTAAVAPERIEKGLRELVGRTGFLNGAPLALIRYQRIAWLNTLRMQMDRVDYAWQRWVLGFDPQQQVDLLTDLLGDINPFRVALTFLLTGAVVLGAIGFRLGRQIRPLPATPVNRIYYRFCAKLTRLGFVRNKQETPGTFALRVIALRPDLEPEVMAVTRLYEALCYERRHRAGAAASEQRLAGLVAQFKPRQKRTQR